LPYTPAVRLNTLFDHVLDYPPAPERDSGSRVKPTEAPDARGESAESSGAGAPDAAGPSEEIERRFPGGGGVYLLTDADEQVIQLASAGHLRRALRTRLCPTTTPGDNQARAASRRRADLSQIVRRIWWRTAHSGFEITYQYWRIARSLMPRTYLKQIAFGPSWFVHVDPAARTPRFAAGKILRAGPGVDLGPLATHQDATRFVQILQDSFDLCRHDPILEQAPHGQACAYFDMSKCPAPCNGSIPLSAYREMIAGALAFARGQRAGHYLRWERQMREAADRRAFEQAAAAKQRLQRARAIEHRAYALARPIEAFNYLILQRGGGRTRVKPFFVRAGRIRPAATVKLKDVDDAAADWVRQMTETPKPQGTVATDEPLDRQEVSEQIWLVSHFLFKRETPGLFIHASQLPEPRALAEQVRDVFTARRREPTPGDADHAPLPGPRGQAGLSQSDVSG